MRIEPAALAKAIGALDEVDLNRGLGPSVLQLMTMVKQLFDADAVGLMLVDAGGCCAGRLLLTSRPSSWNRPRKHSRRGPVPMRSGSGRPCRSATSPARAGEEIAAVLLGARFRAALSVPVELAGGPIGTLDAYVRSERRWNESEVSALQACAGVVANLLGQAVAAWTQGRLARQLQIALEHRVVIEQAKGALMEREGVDAAIAFERLRSSARSRHRTVVEVTGDVLAGGPLPSDPAGTIHQTTELAVIAYQQAAGLHERIAALYEQLGHPDRARQEWQRAAGARARAERAESERGSQDRPVAPWDS